MTRKHALLLRNIAWAIFIFILCALPANSIPNPQLNIPHLDKIVHYCMFFIMALFLCSELNYQTKLKTHHIYLITIGISSVYGGIIEILQDQFFQRSGDWLDLIADILGAITGCILYPAIRKIKKKTIMEH